MQWLSSFKSLRLHDPAVFAHCHNARIRRRAFHPVCQAASTVTDSRPKPKPGRPKKSAADQLEHADIATDTSDPPKKTKKRKKKTKDPVDDDDSAEPELVTLPPPWAQLTPEQIEQQINELAVLEQHKSRQQVEQQEQVDIKRLARESDNNVYLHRDPEWLEIENKVFFKTEDG